MGTWSSEPKGNGFNWTLTYNCNIEFLNSNLRKDENIKLFKLIENIVREVTEKSAKC